MLIYIWFRFKDIRFAASAVLALVHDVWLLCLPSMHCARSSVGSTFIACMLTIVGYSINATIVIFDRIREELRVMKRSDDLKDACKQKYHIDTDKKYLHNLYYICHGSGSLYHGCKLY